MMLIPPIFVKDGIVGQSYQGMGIKYKFCLGDYFGEKDINSPWEWERETKRFHFNLRLYL